MNVPSGDALPRMSKDNSERQKENQNLEKYFPGGNWSFVSEPPEALPLEIKRMVELRLPAN